MAAHRLEGDQAMVAAGTIDHAPGDDRRGCQATLDGKAPQFVAISRVEGVQPLPAADVEALAVRGGGREVFAGRPDLDLPGRFPVRRP